ncbi:MAG: ABC transporter ATP-binding protein [Synergistaceae bacterium]|nr:ABC transporter ATP-binding protein [Synergistaceae bacterium]
MIEFERVSKKFKLYSTPADRLREIIFRKPMHSEYQALSDVSFRVSDGQTLGIIGPNGAGKSTVLKILMGILIPDSGAIRMSGRVTGLLELGTGFNIEMTGEQNIFMNGLLLGMSRAELEAKKEAIIEFSELGDFIAEPIKTYSSGMVMRLAFSIAIHAAPSCFVVDEALSVGDAHFSQKCMRAIREFRSNGGSIIFVSHDLNAVKMLCDEAILLNKGAVLSAGDPETVINSYNHLIALMNDADGRMKLETAGKKTSYGNMDMVIESVEIAGQDSNADVVSSGEIVDIAVNFRSAIESGDLTVGILIRDRFGQDIYGTNTALQKVPVPVKPQCRYRCVFTVPMNIAPGKYNVTAALHVGESHLETCYNWQDRVTEFVVAGVKGQLFAGLARLESSVACNEICSDNSILL